MADGPAAGNQISCAMTSALVRLVRRDRSQDALDDLLALAGSHRTVAFLEDRENWVSLHEAMALLGAGARLTEDPTFARRVGEEAVRQHAGSQVSTLLRSLGSPEAVLAATATASRKFSTVTEMAPVESEPGHALVRAVARPGFRREQLHCDWAAGLLSQATVLFGLPPARVVERECQARGGSQCLYDISWDADLAAAAEDPEARVRAVEAQLSGMAARLENVYATAIDLVSPDDLDTVLDRIVQRAAGEVRATGYALAVRPRPDGGLQVYCHGVDDGAARALVAGAAGGEEASCLRVGVASSRRTYGELVAGYPDGLDFFAQERRLLQLYAKHAAAVLDMATALDEAAQRHEQVSALLALSNALAHAGTSPENAARLAGAVPGGVDCDRVGVLIWAPLERQLRHAGGEDAILGDLAITPGDTPSLERMIDEPQPAFVAPDTDDPFLAEVMARLGA